MKDLRHLLIPATAIVASAIIAGCDPIPPLHLHYEQPLEVEFPVVEVNIDVMWQYDLAYQYGYDTLYDWRKEWKYGWDDQDSLIFGSIGYTKPEAFHFRRYFTNLDPNNPRSMVTRDYVEGTKFRSTYNFGYYDFLVWNDIITKDGVHNSIFDEETTLDSVTVATNPTNYGSRYQAPLQQFSYNQPDEIFSAEELDVYISKNKEDYDYYDEVTKTYYKYLDMTLLPVTYIYLTQVIIHHNWGKVVGTDGNANFSNFAYSTCLNSGMAGKDPITVHYNNRLKQGIVLENNETVDIVGGRLLTYGIRGINPFRYSNPLQMPEEVRKQKHYLDVNLLFGNGYDSTLVFDVTDQVLKRYRGGVITVELNLDTVRSPGRSGGSGFDAVVEDWVEETHEFEVTDKENEKIKY